MSIVDVKETDLQAGIVNKLRSDLKLNKKQCFEMLGTEPPTIPRGGDYYVTVGMAGGDFTEIQEQAKEQCFENAQFSVNGHTRVSARDHTDVDTTLLHAASRGLLEIKRRFLQSLVGADVADPNGNSELRSTLRAVRTVEPRVYKHQTDNYMVGTISVFFSVEFDHDLMAE